MFLLILGFLIIHDNWSGLFVHNCAQKICTFSAQSPQGSEGFQLQWILLFLFFQEKQKLGILKTCLQRRCPSKEALCAPLSISLFTHLFLFIDCTSRGHTTFIQGSWKNGFISRDSGSYHLFSFHFRTVLKLIWNKLSALSAESYSKVDLFSRSHQF